MFKGIHTSLITPFRNGEIDVPTLDLLVDRQLRDGIHGFSLLTCDGEGMLLSPAERELIISRTAKRCATHADVTADCSAVSPLDVVENTRMAGGSGARAALVSPPAYLRPSEDGLLGYFLAVASESPIPIIVHNDPLRTGCTLAHALLVRLAEHENIIALAQSDHSLPLLQQLGQTTGGKLSRIGAMDSAGLPMLLAGCSALFVSSANAVPGKWLELWHHWQRNDVHSAEAVQAALSGLHQAFILETGPGPLKAALNLVGICDPEVRLPNVWPLRPTAYRLAAEIDKLGLQIQNGELS